MSCSLLFRDTPCGGPVVPFETERGTIMACIDHQNIFLMMCELYELGVDTEALQKLSVRGMQARLQMELENGEKILADEEVQET